MDPFRSVPWYSCAFKHVFLNEHFYEYHHHNADFFSSLFINIVLCVVVIHIGTVYSSTMISQIYLHVVDRAKMNDMCQNRF